MVNSPYSDAFSEVMCGICKHDCCELWGKEWDCDICDCHVDDWMSYLSLEDIWGD